MMHLTCTNMPIDKLDAALKEVRAQHVCVCGGGVPQGNWHRRGMALVPCGITHPDADGGGSVGGWG